MLETINIALEVDTAPAVEVLERLFIKVATGEVKVEDLDFTNIVDQLIAAALGLEVDEVDDAHESKVLN